MKTTWPRGKSLPKPGGSPEKWQALDVADGSADLNQNEVDAVVALQDEVLDGVGDVRNHLHRRAEEIAAPLLGDQLLIDASGGDVILLVGAAAGEALVMAKVEVGLGFVIGDEHLAMLGLAHRARIDVQIGIKLAQADGVAGAPAEAPLKPLKRDPCWREETTPPVMKAIYCAMGLGS